MLHFKSSYKPFYLILLVECCLFCVNFLFLFKAVLIDIGQRNISAAMIFEVLFFCAWFVTALWLVSEILFLRSVLLTDGCLVLKRGVFITRKIPYDSILRLERKEDKIEYSARASIHNNLLYSGEKLKIITKKQEVVLHSIWLGDYMNFRNKVSQLAINARLHSPGKFKENESYFELLVGGIFILVMSYVNLFK